MTAPLKLAVFISGRGSNMQALAKACESADFPAEIALVLANKPDAAGLEYARDKGFDTALVPHKDYPDKQGFVYALLEALSNHKIDLICLAGFMRVLSPHFLDRAPAPIINIHPSLLPKYPGLNTHERALAAGDTQSGCSVHYVTAGVDEGPVILQRFVPILDGDTPETLAARILHEEHIAYPAAVKTLANELGA